MSSVMAPKEDSPLPPDIDRLTGFDNLIGSQAQVAKQLDLWWRWELPPESSDGSSDEDEGASNESEAPEERLVRKKQHTMPFLMRNISNCPFQSSINTCRRRRRTTKQPAVESTDVISRCFGIGSPNKAKRKRNQEDSTSLIRSIRHKITGWFSSPSEDRALSPMGSVQSQDVVFRSRPLTAHELYTGSSEVHQMIMDGIDPSLHHDEELILNRLEAAWQDMVSGQIKAEERKKRGAGSAMDTDDLSSTEGDISRYSYWLDLEEKDRMKFQVEQRTRQRKKQKVEHVKSVPSVNLLSRNRMSNRPVYYHYMHMSKSNQPCTTVEKRMDIVCPFCVFCAKSDEDLLGHHSIFHGFIPEYYPWKDLRFGFSFEAVMDEEKHLHIVIKSLNCGSVENNNMPDNFTYVRSKKPIAVVYSIPFLRRSHQNVAAMDPLSRRRRLLALETNDAPASVISSYLPTEEVPVRQYYHSRTNLPLEDWNENDSDDEPDDEWLHKMSADLIGEFEDISDREKKFMQMWNRFIKSHIVIADRDIPGKCQEFIRANITELKAGGMRNNLLLHLMNLWDSGVVSSSRIMACMHQYDNGHVH